MCIFIKYTHKSQGGKVIYFIKEGISFKLVKNTKKIIIFLIMAMIMFILSILFIGVEKFFSFLGMFFVIVLLLGAVAINNKKITFDSEKNKVEITDGLFSKKVTFKYSDLLEFNVVKETYYGFIPTGVSVVAYFSDNKKNKVSVNIRREMFTKKTNWAQTLIEEISDIMEVSTNKIKLDSIETK